MRKPWSEAELEDVGLGWDRFHNLHPDRSYDSWEVKRRRVAGGTAGSRLITRRERVLTLKAVEALHALTDFVEAHAR